VTPGCLRCSMRWKRWGTLRWRASTASSSCTRP
jgi:hypothetical protein